MALPQALQRGSYEVNIAHTGIFVLIVLPMDNPTEVDGALVTPIDANHCPGAVLLLFQLRGGRTVLHTGDFRYDPATMSRHPSLLGLRASGHALDLLYLDTTYATAP